MTLVLNEIHLVKGLTHTVLVAAADRRITRRDGSYDSTRKRLFHIPYLDAAVAYYGLAAVYPHGKQEYLSSCLPNFIKSHSSITSLQDFAAALRDELHRVIPNSMLRDNPSGFHISGYRRDGLPDFWHLTNVGSLRGPYYSELQPRYKAPTSDFLARDARRTYGWDGKNPSSTANGAHVYRNGDFRAHAIASEHLDEALAGFFEFSDFRKPRTTAEYGNYVKFKLEVLAYTYHRWAKKKLIGKPIDVIVRSRGVK